MSRGARKAVRWVFACGAVAALLYGGWWYLCEEVLCASLAYQVEADFSELPPNDDSLKEWLNHQPGVFQTAVGRADSGKVLQVSFLMSRNLHGKPPTPDLDAACAGLGYRGQRARFRDVERPPAK